MTEAFEKRNSVEKYINNITNKTKEELKELANGAGVVTFYVGKKLGKPEAKKSNKEVKKLNGDISIDKLTPGDKITPEQENIIKEQLQKKQSPVTFEMVRDSSIVHNVPMELLLAVMQNDSGLGTVGKGARTHNPGNVGNTDGGGTKDFGTREKGVDACAKNIKKRIDAYVNKIGGIPIIGELLTGKSRTGKTFFGIYMTDPKGPDNVLSIVKTRAKKLGAFFSGN